MKSESLALEAQQFLESGEASKLEAFFDTLHPVELVELIEASPTEHRVELLKNVKGLDQLTSIFEYGSDQLVENALPLIDETRKVAVARRLEADNAANMLRFLNRRQQVAVLKRLSGSRVKELKSLLSYDQEMAGAIMTPLFIEIDKDSSCNEILTNVRAGLQSGKIDPDTDITYFYVTGEQCKLLGLCSLREILTADGETKASDIMSSNVISVGPETDQEEVAHLIADYNFSSIPVCEGEDSRLLGIVTLDDVVDVIEEENTEDFLKLAGTEDEDTVGAPVMTAVKSRFPWLLASWVGGVLGALILGRFETQLEQMVALAFFMPVVFGMGGNVGSQATTITVRGLATGDLSSLKIFSRLQKELRASLVLGLFFGLLLAVTSWLLFADYRLCLVTSVSIVIIMTLAASIGSMVPIVFQKLGFDPAVASAPLVTTSTDILSILIYFSIASAALI